jgi:hypothetical protein
VRNSHADVSALNFVESGGEISLVFEQDLIRMVVDSYCSQLRQQFTPSSL